MPKSRKHRSRKRRSIRKTQPAEQAVSVNNAALDQGPGFGSALAAGFGLGVGEAAGEDLFDSLFGGRRKKQKSCKKKASRRKTQTSKTRAKYRQ